MPVRELQTSKMLLTTLQVYIGLLIFVGVYRTRKIQKVYGKVEIIFKQPSLLNFFVCLMRIALMTPLHHMKEKLYNPVENVTVNQQLAIPSILAKYG